MLIFERKQVNPFSNGEKLPIFCTKYFVREKFCQNPPHVAHLFWQKIDSVGGRGRI